MIDGAQFPDETAEFYLREAEAMGLRMYELELRVRDRKKWPDQADSAQREIDRRSGDLWLFEHLCRQRFENREALVAHLNAMIADEPSAPEAVDSPATFLEAWRQAIRREIIRHGGAPSPASA